MQPDRDAQESTSTLLVGGIASDDGAAATISVHDFVRSQLDGRFGHIVVGSGVGALSPAALRLVAHNCAAHLVPGGTLVLATSVAGLEKFLTTSGFTPLSGGSSLGSAWRRVERRTIHDVVAEARGRLDRVTAEALQAALDEGAATVIDIRVPDDRRLHGVIDPSVSVPRTVLEWRMDPTSGYSIPALDSFEQRLVVVCNEGYSSSLAAATLVDLGFENATDLIGGMVAWLRAGLPVSPPPGDDEVFTGPIET